MMPSMRISAAISLLILAAAAFIGWMGQVKITALRGEREKLSAEATALGISFEDLEKGDHAHQRTKRERADKLAEARRAALDIIDLAKELERLQESGEATDVAMQDRILKALEQLGSLDADQLKVLICEFRDADGLGDGMRRGLLNFAAGALSERNPKAALELLAGNGNPLGDIPDRRSLVHASLSNWAQADPSGALAWLRTRSPDDIEQESLETALVRGAARSDLRLALKQIREFGFADRGDVLNEIAGDLSDASRRTELLRLMDEEPELYGEKERGIALETLGREIGKSGYAEGVRWIRENKLSEPEITRLIEGSNMMHHAKGDETGRWVEWMGESLSEGSRDRIISQQIREWTEKDHRAAGEWLAALPDGPSKPASVAAFAKTVAPHDPQVAAQWALTLPPGGKRKETLQAVYEKWPEDDPARATFMREHPAE